jgi:polysaccharide export outer membrane protein
MRTAVLLSLCLWSLACSAIPTAPLQPKKEELGFAAVHLERAVGLEPETPGPFSLLPGDRLRVRLLSDDEGEPFEAVVDGGGELQLPLGVRARVEGMQLEEARQALETSVRQLDRFAVLSLALLEPAGHQATVVGQVVKPGSYVLQNRTRVATLLARAGGELSHVDERGELMALGDLRATRLLRDDKPLPIDIDSALQGDPRHNVLVHPGDTLFVPPLTHSRVMVLGDVNKPKTVRYRHGMRLTEALAVAGGAADTSDRSDVRVVRGPLSAPRIYRVDLAALMDGDGRDAVLAPGDVVFVTRHWFATAAETLERLTPLVTTAAIGVALAK